jgi:hypothetical protein
MPSRSAKRGRRKLCCTMRTNSKSKLILLTIALAAGSITSFAQVYSLNVVGYYNLSITATQLTLIANQLNTTNHTIGSLIPAPPAGSSLYKLTNSNEWIEYQFDADSGGWVPDDLATLDVGEGAFFVSPQSTTLTFVGEVLQGDVSRFIPGSNALSVVASAIPISGKLFADFHFPEIDGATIYFLTNTSLKFTLPMTCFAGSGWYPPYEDPDDPSYSTDPTLVLGNAFFVHNPGAGANWTRNFTVQKTGTDTALASAVPLRIGRIRIGDEMVRLDVSNPKGASYAVQFSADYSCWITVSAGQVGSLWTEPLRPGRQGFYRLMNL